MKLVSKNLLFVITIILSLSLAGCGSSSKKTAAPSTDSSSEMTADEGTASNLEINGDSDSGKAGALKTVFFDFNSSTLSGSAKADLDSNVQFLQENSAVTVQVEGHCDERGGVQYNIALGEKRAESTKAYLVSAGIDSSRVSTISYGKERPITFGHDDGAWGQNRRSNFVVLSK